MNLNSATQATATYKTKKQLQAVLHLLARWEASEDAAGAPHGAPGEYMI